MNALGRNDSPPRHHRGRALLRLALCLLCLPAGAAFAAGLAFLDAPQAEGLPGAYVTLPFTVEGQGSYTFHVIAPEGWLPLSQDRKLTLAGRQVLPVTVRVPTAALGGARAEIRVQALSSGASIAQASGSIAVKGMYAVALSAPAEREGEADEPLSFHVRVQNLGNLPDSFTLEAESGAWRTALSKSAVELPPQGSAQVEVTLYPVGRFNDGYRRLLTIRARSSHDPVATALHQVMTVFRNADAAGPIEASEPQLELRVETGLTGTLSIENGRAKPGVAYYLAPNLHGDLSDFVGVSITPAPVQGNQDRPLQIPSSTSVNLTADDWDASLYVSPGSYGLGVGFEAADWRWSVGGNYAALETTPAYGLNLSAVSQSEGLDLQFFGNAALAGAEHTEYVTGLYRTALGDGFSLDLSTSLAGGDPAKDQGYRLTPAVTESLRYFQQDFDLRQSYRVAPTLGLHTLELSGGTRSSYPVGVRASSRMDISPEETNWQSAVSLLSLPARGLHLGLTGSYSTTDFGLEGTYWALSPSFRYSYAFPFGLRSSVSLGYRHLQGLSADVSSSDRYSAGLSNGFERLTLRTGAGYTTSSGPEAGRELTLSAEASYALSPRSELSADYAFTAAEDPDWSATHSYGLSWDHSWTSDLQTELGYRRETVYDAAGRDAVDESLRVSLATWDLFGDDLGLRAGYGLSADAGLLEPGTHYRHELSLSLGYTFSLPFDTPPSLVDAFGGRETGHVAGRAYVDTNLSGTFDPGDTPLAGLELQLGESTTTTDVAGAYELDVPAGRFRFGFPGGLPATLGLTNEKEQEVRLNQTYRHDLAFAPVTNLAVTLFDDANNNGVMDEGETGIPYGGIVIEGPVGRKVQVDSEGRAYLSGLVEGSYRVRADPELLPEHYLPTGTTERRLDPAAPPAPLLVGAAIPRRTVVTTFRSGNLGLLVSASHSSRPAGAELTVRARVQGRAEEVSLEMFGRQVPLEQRSGAWEATLRIPPDAAPGLARGKVRATGSGGVVERPVQVLVTDAPPYRLEPIHGQAGAQARIELRTLFRATSAALVLPGTPALPLTSDDGYLWHGTLRLPEAAVPRMARLLIDGAKVQEVDIQIETPEAAGSQP